RKRRPVAGSRYAGRLGERGKKDFGARIAMKGLPVKHSQSEGLHLVLPSDANALGTIFGGRIMEWIDLIGAITASRHAGRICVTASMDELHFISPVRVGDTVIVKASVNYAHKTSLEVGVRVESENLSG